MLWIRNRSLDCCLHLQEGSKPLPLHPAHPSLCWRRRRGRLRINPAVNARLPWREGGLLLLRGWAVFLSAAILWSAWGRLIIQVEPVINRAPQQSAAMFITWTRGPGFIYLGWKRVYQPVIPLETTGTKAAPELHLHLHSPRTHGAFREVLHGLIPAQPAQLTTFHGCSGKVNSPEVQQFQMVPTQFCWIAIKMSKFQIMAHHLPSNHLIVFVVVVVDSLFAHFWFKACTNLFFWSFVQDLCCRHCFLPQQIRWWKHLKTDIRWYGSTEGRGGGG